MGKLDGKIALVTGGSEGIGFATAKEFITEGATVMITGRRAAELDAAVEKLGSNAVGVQSDVSSLSDLDRVYASIKAKHGKLDILFANAGVFELKPYDQVTEEEFDRHFNTNVKGLFFSVQKALPLMTKGGAIVLNSSWFGNKGLPNVTVYSATKAAVRNFARTFTTELRGTGIRINVVSPGPVLTPGLEVMLKDHPEAIDQVKGMLPLGEMPSVTDIAKAVVFLASDDARSVAGVEFLVDAGGSAV